MISAKIIAVLVALLWAGVGSVAPVAAQDSDSGATSTTTTTVDPTTTTSADPEDEAPETTQPNDGESGESVPTVVVTTVPATTGQGGEGTENPGDETTTTLDPDDPAAGDPLSEEGPTETVPQTELTIPDDGRIVGRGRYARQGEFKPAEVLWSNVREAEEKVEAAKIDLQKAIARVKALRLRAKELKLQAEGLSDDVRATVALLQLAEAQVQERALTAFVRGNESELDAGVDYEELLDLQVKNTLIDSVLQADHRTIADYIVLRDSIEGDVLRSFDRSVLVAKLLVTFEADVQVHREIIEQVERELEAFEAGSPIYIEGVVFPIGELQYEVPLIDSYGFPRMMGTADQHWHEGIDIFAPMGAPLVATERGIITNVGTGKLGGLKVWLRGESGTDWYYAHLSGFAPGLHEGQVVEVGELLGYVGTSGNAAGTPPHLHMQVHPGGGDAINPYPLLWVVSEREIAADVLRQEDERRQAEEASAADQPDSSPSDSPPEIPTVELIPGQSSADLPD